MATIRNTASEVRKGRVGNTSYYYLNGQQVARQARNNSNYGTEARRSVAQQSRRVMWANLVNLYKACSHWMPKAFESKTREQSDYNAFMQKNIASSIVALTKEQSAKGCAVVDSYVISQGSLPPVGATGPDSQNMLYTDIKVSSDEFSGWTLGQFSQDVIANNAGYLDGDNIALILFENWADGTEFPYAATRYYEITLDTTSTAPLSSNPVVNLLQYYTTDGTIGFGSTITLTLRAVGWACIHTRQSGSVLKVSSQQIVLVKPIIRDAFNTELQKTAAMNSYGVDVTVLLDPSFRQAVIRSVSVDGSVVTDWSGKTLSYGRGIELTLTGDLLTEGVRLVHDGVEYTPLSSSGDSITYILGDNGTNTIYVNGLVAFRVVVSGVVVPQVLPNRIEGLLYASPTDISDRIIMQNTNCLNYPFKSNDNYPYFLISIGNSSAPVTDIAESNWAVTNGTIEQISIYSEERVRVRVSVSNATKPAYITYQGFIIAVFNYTA